MTDQKTTPTEVSAPALSVVPGSPLGDFKIANATHAAIIPLANGATLSVATGPDGWAIGGECNGVVRTLALTHEAAAALLSAMIEMPIPPLPNVAMRSLVNT